MKTLREYVQCVRVCLKLNIPESSAPIKTLKEVFSLFIIGKLEIKIRMILFVG